MTPIDAIKRKLHRDVVADPVLHARVLNLYLCGEAYPHAVDDYFPVDHAEEVAGSELAGIMREHMADEDKHIALYAKAIGKLGQEVIQLPEADIFNHVIRSHTAEPWKVEAAMDADAKRDRIANFLAHAHWLEKRIARSLEYHFDACAQAASDYPAKAVGKVLADEQRHQRYTREAVFDLVSKRRAVEIIESHRRAESRANLDFSARELRRLLVEEGEHWPAARKLPYKVCAFVMEGVLACA
ncbi:MAG: ferritin-like domain-containing protein [Novosphingobium sp.]